MLKNKWNLSLMIYIFISSITVLLLEITIIAITIDPKTGKVPSFDVAIIEQIIYFSIWATITNIIWSGINLFYWKTKENNFQPKVSSKQGLTLIVTTNFIVLLIYGTAAIINPSMMVGMNAWWNIPKAVIEHYVNPIILLIAFFALKNEVIKTKKYFIKHSFWVTILPMFYVSFVLIRCFFIHNYSSNGISDFPYIGLSPYEIKPYLSFILVSLLLVLPPFLATLLNFLSNLTIDKLNDYSLKKAQNSLVIEKSHSQA